MKKGDGLEEKQKKTTNNKNCHFKLNFKKTYLIFVERATQSLGFIYSLFMFKFTSNWYGNIWKTREMIRDISINLTFTFYFFFILFRLFLPVFDRILKEDSRREQFSFNLVNKTRHFWRKLQKETDSINHSLSFHAACAIHVLIGSNREFKEGNMARWYRMILWNQRLAVVQCEA